MANEFKSEMKHEFDVVQLKPAFMWTYRRRKTLEQLVTFKFCVNPSSRIIEDAH